jgi:hypothetical protein
MPLRRITDLTWKETFWGQLLGYGTFRFESAGQQQGLDVVTFMPDAKGLYKRLSELMFGTDFSTNSVSDDDGGGGDGGGGGGPGGKPPPPSPGRRHDTVPIPRRGRG